MNAHHSLRTAFLTIALLALAAAAGAALPAADGGAAQSGRLVRTCGTPDPTPAELQSVRAIAREWMLAPRPSAVGGTISVAFHVITSHGEGEVTDQQIAEQVRALNRGYAGTGYRFALASVDRAENHSWFKMAPGTGAERQAKKELAIDPKHRLNIYTCSPGKYLLGWAYFPWSAPEDDPIHGVVVHYGSLPGGYLTGYDLGGTAVHEVGHYLSLLHTFQGGCVPPGDDVEDTPYEASPAFGCPIGRNTCPQPGDDPIHNYMDYTDDACYTEFTAGQTDRVHAILPIYRPSLFDGELAIGGAKSEPIALAGAAGEARAQMPTLAASPNPFRAFSVLRFSLPAAAHVSLEVFNVAGQRVANLIDADLPAGSHSAALGAGRLSPGMYFVSLRAGEQRLRRSIILMR